MQIDYLNLKNSVINNERVFFLNQAALSVEVHTQPKKCLKNRKENGYNKPPFYPRNPNNKHNEHNGWKPNTCFRCRSEDHFIANFLKPDTSNKKVHWNTEKPKACAYRSKKIDNTPEKITEESSHRRYTRLLHICIPMQKVLETIIEIYRNWPIGF